MCVCEIYIYIYIYQSEGGIGPRAASGGPGGEIVVCLFVCLFVVVLGFLLHSTNYNKETPAATTTL